MTAPIPYAQEDDECLTDSCSPGVNELITSARFSVAIGFHSKYNQLKIALG
jgi:hypothetical protein